MSKDCLFMHATMSNNEASTESLLTVRFQKYHFQTVLNSSFCCKGPWSSINQKVRNRKMLDFTSFSITQLEKVTFYVQINNEPSTESLLTVDSKNIIFTVINSSFCCKGPGKTYFGKKVQRRSSYATMRHRQKAYWPTIPKIPFSDRAKF